MKRHWIILLLAFVVGAACSGRRGQGLLLDKADSLVTVKPDSALCLLEHLPVRSLHTEEERARYALLLTEARDRCYVVQTDDSLIRTAVDYYDAQGDAGMRARAYYRWGSVLRDKKEQARAVEKYLEAVDLAGEAGDKGLQGRIYANLGFLYYRQKLYIEADSLYQLSEIIGWELTDMLLVADMLSMRGRICFINKEYAKAKHLLWQADSVSKDLPNDKLRSNIYSYLSQIYAKEKNFKLAIAYAKRNLEFPFDTEYRYRNFMFLGDAYFRAGRLDSAEIFFKRCMCGGSNISKANAYMRMSSIAQRRGNHIQALNFRKKYEAYVDSAKLEEQSYEVQQAITNYEFECQQNNFKRILYAYRYLLMLLAGGVVLWIYIYRKWTFRKIAMAQSCHLAVKHQYEQVKRELSEKIERIESLEKDKEQRDLSLKDKEHLQKGLKELHKHYQDLKKVLNSHSDVSMKMERILQDYRARGYSKEALSYEDWTQLSVELDSMGKLFEVCMGCGLTEEEMHYCLLLLTDFSIGDRAKILHLSRQTPYRWEKEICIKMGIEYQAGVLKQVISDRIKE